MLRIDRDNQIQLTIDSFIGNHVAVFGITGSGKTTTAAVLLEEFLPYIPLTIVDIEGELWGLKEKFNNILIVGRCEYADFKDVTPENIGAIATFSVENRVPVILDLSGYDEDNGEIFEYLLPYLTSLWLAISKARIPYQLMIDEVHEFCPQSGRTPVSGIIKRFGKRGRKRGIGMLVVSQRSQEVDKALLDMMTTNFFHRVTHPNAIAFYKKAIPLPAKEVEEHVRSLPAGTAIFVHDGEAKTVAVRQRDTFHVGRTPDLDKERQLQLQKVDGNLLSELTRLMAASSPEVEIDPADAEAVQALETALAASEKQCKALQAEVQRLTTENKALLTKAKAEPVPVHVPRIEAIEPYKPNPPQAEVDDGRSPLATKRATNKQGRDFQQLTMDVRVLSAMHRLILIYLSHRPDLNVGTKELARYLGYSHSTLVSSPPAALVRWKLLKRSGSRGNYRYASNVEKRLAELFPDLDSEQLAEVFLRDIRPKQAEQAGIV